MKPIHFAPVIIFFTAAIIFYVGLGLQPSQIPSAKVGKPVPSFSMPLLYKENENFTDADLKTGKIALVNVFASWCAPCRDEHPILMALKNRDIPIYSLNYKDTAAPARLFLDGLGNPFTKVGQDQSGRVGLDWGVTGVPETFVVSGDGRILYQHIGPLTSQAVLENILPLLEGKQP